jgi:hypothetical protein
MRQKMDKTLAGLNDKLGALERQVSGTFTTVKDSVNSVRDTFDVKLQVRRRPWVLVAGAAALGFLGGFRSNGHRAGNDRNDGTPQPRIERAEAPFNGGSSGTNGADATRLDPAAAPGWGAKWGGRLQPEISALRGVAMGALLELAREMISKSVTGPPGQLAAEAHKGSNGKPGVHTVRARVSAKRRQIPALLHPLEGVRDGKTVRCPR